MSDKRSCSDAWFLVATVAFLLFLLLLVFVGLYFYAQLTFF
jgi:hypothetical protein